MTVATLVPGAPRCDLGEGPVWDARRDVLVWVDLFAGLVHQLDLATRHSSTVAIGRPVSKALPEGDGWLLCTERGFETRDAAWRTQSAVDVLDLADRVRMNDAALDAVGRLYGGTLHLDDEPGHGIFFRLSPAGDLDVIAKGVGISNGIGWSPDGRTLHHVDSLAGLVTSRAYDPATGDVGDPVTMYSAAGTGELPDGLAVDAEGCLWVAFWDGSVIRRISPDGVVVDAIDVPVLRPTSVAFGGADLSTLFITTARDDSGAGGQLYQCRVEIPGLPLPIPPAHQHRLEGLHR